MTTHHLHLISRVHAWAKGLSVYRGNPVRVSLAVAERGMARAPVFGVAEPRAVYATLLDWSSPVLPEHIHS